ncbi:hypothetical protein [Burkholderia cenocepacia]|uniref:hypothetical protein n=1 Tax=Burkholderia cenocepacia TaxID=95486 RepID=UPI002B253E64|nr:hypothetical protein [Burkholderia cenocepacia]MEB2499533.1 hypothetical protein [Burkholderia cenocepacia]MEB2557208.1 hypothetical protein [Burkholderia cenocepacia]
MAHVSLSRFGGVVPRYNRALLRENMASDAVNVRLWHGTLAPFRVPHPVHVASVEYARTIYRFGCCWLAWDHSCVDVAEWLPSCERVYVTGWQTYPVAAALPASGCDFDWRRVGLPTPETPPTATSLDGTLPERTTSSRSYVYTWVDSWGGEGCPSWPSNALLDAREGAPVRVSIPGPPAGWDVAAVRLYRVAEGFNDGTKPAASTPTRYLFVAELSAVAQDFVDTLMSDQLGEANVSAQFTPPPDGLAGIVALPDGVLAGFVGKQVWFCEPYEPQAWPVDTMLMLDDHVRALRWHDGVLYAMTDGHPYAIADECIEGTCCRKAYRFPKAAPIASPKSPVVAPHGVVYASDIGLTLLSGRRMATLTSPWYARDDWQALLPHTMAGALVDGQYFASTCKAAFLFDLRDGTENDGESGNDLMPLSLTPNALHTARDGKLYLAFGNVIHEWDAGAAFLPYRWRSKLMTTQDAMNFACAKIVFEGYPWPQRAPHGVTVCHVADGRPVLKRLVRHGSSYRLPSGRRGHEHTIEIQGIETVREIHMATSVADLDT